MKLEKQPKKVLIPKEKEELIKKPKKWLQKKKVNYYKMNKDWNLGMYA